MIKMLTSTVQIYTVYANIYDLRKGKINMGCHSLRQPNYKEAQDRT